MVVINNAFLERIFTVAVPVVLATWSIRSKKMTVLVSYLSFFCDISRTDVPSSQYKGAVSYTRWRSLARMMACARLCTPSLPQRL